MLKQKIIKNIVNITLGSLIILIIHSTSYGHSGRTNSEGCHKDNKKNNYHCHSPKKKENLKKDYKSFKVIDGDTIHFENIKYRFSGMMHQKKQFANLKIKNFYMEYLQQRLLKKKY